MNDELYEKWLTQFRKGYLELCVLVALEAKESAYGLELLQQFKTSGLDVNEGTLYPLLNRMQKNGWLDSHWQTPSDSGHPRRFYQLSDTGKSLLPQMQAAHAAHRKILKKIEDLK